MKIMLKDLFNISDEKVYEFDIESLEVKDNLYLRRIEKVSGYICFYYGSLDELRTEYHICGNMICPDAITLQDVEVPFDFGDDLKVVNKENDDGFYLNQDMDIDEMALYLVTPEAPIKVVKNKEMGYSKGDNWSFVSEEDYEASKKDKIDPRLQILKEYKFEEDK